MFTSRPPGATATKFMVESHHKEFRYVQAGCMQRDASARSQSRRRDETSPPSPRAPTTIAERRGLSTAQPPPLRFHEGTAAQGCIGDADAYLSPPKRFEPPASASGSAGHVVPLPPLSSRTKETDSPQPLSPPRQQYEQPVAASPMSASTAKRLACAPCIRTFHDVLSSPRNQRSFYDGFIARPSPPSLQPAH